MKLNQKGFSLIEGLLILIAISLIGFIGYFVYDKNKNEEPAQQNNTSQQSKPLEEVATKKQQYYEFKELGVKIPIDEKLADLSYGKEEDMPFLFLTTEKLKQLIDSCNEGSEYYSGPGKSDPIVYTFISLGKNNGNYKDREDELVGLIKQFPDFHISAGYPQGPSYDPECKDAKEIRSLMTSSGDAVAKAFKNAELIQ